MVRLVPLQSDLRLEHEGALEDVYQQVGGHGDDVVGVRVEKVMALVMVVTRWSDCMVTWHIGSYRFYKVNVLDIITITCFITSLHLGITKMSSASRIEHQEALGFAYRSRKRFMWIAVVFCH